MAKQTEEIKKNKVLEILTKEYPFESTLMAFLGIIVTIIGVYLIQGDLLSINQTSDWWNSWIFGTDTGILIFSIFITVVGAVAILVALWPFYNPSFAEMKKVTWPTGIIIRNHTARVFGFILILAAFFMLYDLGLQPLIEWLKSLG